jgi:hypothetical protein
MSEYARYGHEARFRQAGPGERLRIGLSAIGWFLLVAAFLLGLPVLAQLPGWVLALLALVALLLALPVFLVLRAWRRRRGQHAGSSLGSWLRCSFVSILLVGTAVGAPVYYLSYRVEAAPLILPQATLSNGEKTVVFQGMLHIGSEGFYKSVVYDLEVALAAGYRLFYEGVQPSTAEADRWFSDTLAGGKDLSASHKEMAGACGLAFQLDWFEPLVADMKERPQRHLTADVTTAEMKAEFDRLVASDASFAAEASRKRAQAATGDADGGPLDAVLNMFRNGTAGQKQLAGLVCRGMFSMLLDPRNERPAAQIDRVLLDFRNVKLVERILAEPNPRIYITYGTAHLKGVLALLQQNDPRWKVASVKWVRGIGTPEHFDRPL